MSKSLTLYLPATFEAQVGSTDVRLFGLAQVGSSGASFAIGDDTLTAPGLTPPNLTSSIPRPLGLPGLTLVQLRLAGSIMRGDGQTQTNLSIEAQASFDALQLNLTAAVVLDNGSARLAFVRLSTAQPLTLTQILTSLVGGVGGWAAPVTDQFAFVSGSLSMLSAPAGAPSTYTYSYGDADGGVTVYQPGFRAQGAFQIFGRFDFTVMLGVGEAIDRATFGLSGYTPVATDVTVVTTSPASIDFDFITLSAPNLQIARLQTRTIMQISSQIVLFGTQLQIGLLVSYDTSVDGFTGQVTAAAGGLQLTIGVRWTEAGGFALISIDGLGDQVMALLSEFEDILNNVRGQGCEKIVGDWLNDAAGSKIKPALNGSPTRGADGYMTIPLTLTYDLIFDDDVIYSVPIGLTPRLRTPTSLDDLPSAIWDSITASAGTIATQVLQDPGAYEALAIEIGRRVGAAAFARFICRALQEALEELAKAIARVATALVTDAIGAVAELAGALVAVALLGLNVVLNLFEQIWDEIKSWFSGGDSKKDEAEQKIRDIQASVQQTLDDVDAKISQATAQMAVSALNLSLTGSDDDLTVAAQVVWARGWAPNTDSNDKLTVLVEYLTGPPGDVSGVPLAQQDLALATTVPLSQLTAKAGPDGYGMNARVTPSISGFVFMNSDTAGRIQSAIDSLRGLDNGVADDFANYLAACKKTYQDYNRNGISGAAVYAAASTPYTTQVDVSRLGVNSRTP
jgi:hypothetical protein